MTAANSRFSTWRDRVAQAHILIAGDVMLDRYWFGDVERISPEAPVPVVKIARSEERPGGAANVARNAAALGARTTLVSATGIDEAGAALERLLAADNVRTSFHRDSGFATTVKLRVVGRQQQLLRIDFETVPSHEVLATKLADYERLLVDPKGDDWARYRGATAITPNRSEFRQVVGRWKDAAEMANKAQALRAELDLDAILVTRGEEGMSLYTASGTEDIPAVAREVYDVSGAGDTVIAALGVLLAAGADLGSAVRISNEAAGVVVGKLGTAVVTPDELA